MYWTGVSEEPWFTYRLHDAISQKMSEFIPAAARTSDLTVLILLYIEFGVGRCLPSSCLAMISGTYADTQAERKHLNTNVMRWHQSKLLTYYNSWRLVQNSTVDVEQKPHKQQHGLISFINIFPNKKTRPKGSLWSKTTTREFQDRRCNKYAYFQTVYSCPLLSPRGGIRFVATHTTIQAREMGLTSRLLW